MKRGLSIVKKSLKTKSIKVKTFWPKISINLILNSRKTSLIKVQIKICKIG